MTFIIGGGYRVKIAQNAEKLSPHDQYIDTEVTGSPIISISQCIHNVLSAEILSFVTFDMAPLHFPINQQDSDLKIISAISGISRLQRF